MNATAGGGSAIYDSKYRRYVAREALRRIRFWPITREALRALLGRRAFDALLMLCWLPLVFRVLQVWIVTQFPDVGRGLPVDGRLFGEFLNGQTLLALFVSIFGGAGLIANDLRTGAILVYLSRPLTRRDYILGKLGVLLALNLSVTLVPAALLYVVALAVATETFAKLSLAWIPPAILLHSLAIALVLGLVALAVSALSRSARVAGLGFFGLVMGLDLARTILVQVVDARWAAPLSILGNLRGLGALVFGLATEGVSGPWAVAALGIVALGCLQILRVRVRAVEIVR